MPRSTFRQMLADPDFRRAEPEIQNQLVQGFISEVQNDKDFQSASADDQQRIVGEMQTLWGDVQKGSTQTFVAGVSNVDEPKAGERDPDSNIFFDLIGGTLEGPTGTAVEVPIGNQGLVREIGRGLGEIGTVLAGGAGGAAAGSAILPGIGTVAGGLIGAGLTSGVLGGTREALRQQRSGQDVNVPSVLGVGAIDAALGALPGGKQAKLATRALRGAAVAGGGGAAINALQQFADKGQVDLGQALGAGAIQAPIGAAGSAFDPKMFAKSKAANELLEASVPTNPSATQALKPRKFGLTVQGSELADPQVAAGIQGQYRPITNKSTLESAQQLIDVDIDEAIRRVKFDDSPPTAETFAIGQDLIRRFQKEGRFQDAIDIVETVSERATQAGQAIQALSMWNRLTPEGALRAAQRQAARAGRELSPDLAEDITKQANKLKDMPEGNAKDLESAKLMQLVAKAKPPEFLDKVNSLQTMAMLLNPKTAIRNILGNSLFGGFETLSDTVAAGLDAFIALGTKKRTIVLPDLRTALRGGKQGFKQGVQEALEGVDTSGIDTKFDLPRVNTFDNKFLNGLEKVLSIELKASDRAFYQATFRETLLNQIRAERLNGNPRVRITDEMLARAHHEGLYRTFQDPSALANSFSKIKKSLNGGRGFGLGDFILKFPKTPANLLQRAIDYSPINTFRVLYEGVAPIVGKTDFNQREFVQHFARTITGTGLVWSSGFALGKLGLATGEPLSNRDLRAAQRQLGKGAYRINTTAMQRLAADPSNLSAAKERPGDIFVSYDWAQPMAIPFSAGVNMAVSATESAKDRAVSMMESVMDATVTAVDTLTDQPLLQGVQRFFGARGKGGRFSVAEGAKGVAENAFSSFVPTLFSQMNQLMDNTVRETFDPSLVRRTLNRAKARVPGLAQTLPQKRNVKGEVLERFQNDSNNPLNVFLNPSFVGQKTDDPILNEVERIFESSGDRKQALKVVPNSVSIQQGGKKVQKKLTGEEKGRYQEIVGKLSVNLYNRVLENPLYQRLSDSGKAKVLGFMKNNANAVAKIEALGHQPKKKSVNKLGRAILRGDEAAVEKEIRAKFRRQLRQEE